MEWCHIFKTGRHKDSKGIEHNWTLEDLEKIKQNFKEKKLNVPIAIGHIKTSSPAYGWVDDIKIEKENLYAKYKDVQPEFKEAYKKGLFKERSISLDKDLNLRHIAFLGAQAPAIKGLEQFCFENSEDDLTICFCQYENTNKGEAMNIEELEKTLSEKEEKITALETKLKKQKEEKLSKDFEDFCDNAIKDGNIIPAQKNDVLEIFESCVNSIDFEDENEKNPISLLKKFVSNLKQFDFEETAKQTNVALKKDIDFQDAQEIKEAIIEIQKEYKAKGIELNPIEALNKMREPCVK